MNPAYLIDVGIMARESIAFILDGPFRMEGKDYEGGHTVQRGEGGLIFEGKTYRQLCFEPLCPQTGHFTLRDVVIGVDFHWERKEDQTFTGALLFIVEDHNVRAVNRLSVEDYLISVIASEMSASSTLEYLKAHCVISRSWLLSQIEKRNASATREETSFNADTREPGRWIKWWDREDHLLFDVCADDHCQRYQGITRPSQSMEKVRQAVSLTCGECLVCDNRICDARFSKCCGGYMETFDTCWEPVRHPYLQGKYDGVANDLEGKHPDLRKHDQAREWILSSPPAFCNTRDQAILSQVLNSYDQETTHFYRWEVSYGFEELSALVFKRSGLDFGLIDELVPIERGPSGRICKLQIKGSKMSMVIGKELLIRKVLSESHLYSSAFVVDKTPDGFLLRGAGWGHGVGFCQIGGAVMAYRGYSYKEILRHYFPGSILEKRY